MLTTENYRIKQYSETPLDELLKEIGEDRETFVAPEPVISAHEEIETVTNESTQDVSKTTSLIEKEPEKPAVDPKEMLRKRTSTSKFLAKNTDRAMAFVAAVISETDDPEEWKAHPEDVDDIQAAYFEMCESYGWSGLPPWAQLFIALTFTYGPILKEAVKVRGINKAVIERAAQAEAALLIEKKKKQLVVEEKKEVKPVVNQSTELAIVNTEVVPEQKEVVNT